MKSAFSGEVKNKVLTQEKTADPTSRVESLNIGDVGRRKTYIYIVKNMSLLQSIIFFHLVAILYVVTNLKSSLRTALTKQNVTENNIFLNTHTKHD